jgi:hypothetical protein
MDIYQSFEVEVMEAQKANCTRTKNDDLAILVSSPDSYNEVFRIFLKLFNKYWANCEYELILANNVLNYDDSKVTVINCGEDAMSWCQRTVHAVQKINKKYFIVITEDSLISEYIDSNEISNIIKIMDLYSLQYYKLYPKPNANGRLFHGLPHVHEILKKQPYGRNLNTAIWERSYLLKCLGDGTETGWQIEEKWLREAYHAEKGSFDNCVADDRNVLHTIHGVAKGKWLPTALKRLKTIGYEVEVGTRGVIPKRDEFAIFFLKKFNTISSPKLRKVAKITLSKLNFKFTTKY